VRHVWQTLAEWQHHKALFDSRLSRLWKGLSRWAVATTLAKVEMLSVRPRRISRLVKIAVLSAIYTCSLFAQAVPVTVEKVDPSTWLTDSSSGVMLRISGQGMDRVVGVKIRHKGIHVTRVESPDRDHLLVWLRISPDAAGGVMMLQLSTRYMTTFAAVPSFTEKAATSLSADK